MWRRITGKSRHSQLLPNPELWGNSEFWEQLIIWSPHHTRPGLFCANILQWILNFILWYFLQELVCMQQAEDVWISIQAAFTLLVYTHTYLYIYRYTHTHLLFSFLFHCSLLSFAHSVFPWQIKSHSAAWHTIQRNPFNFQTPTADPFSVFLCKEGLRFWIVTITLYSPIISFLLYRWYLRSQRDTDNW